jgi:hypothetical protein
MTRTGGGRIAARTPGDLLFAVERTAAFAASDRLGTSSSGCRRLLGIAAQASWHSRPEIPPQRLNTDP